MALQEQSYASYFEATFPAEADVRVSVPYTDGVTAFVGTLQPLVEDYPDVSDVREGVVYDEGMLVGTLDLPAETDVRSLIQYDNATKTGNVVLPIESDVAFGVNYGANGNEFTGNLVGVGIGYPNETDVRLGVRYGASDEFTGNVRVPTEDKVLAGYQYDANDSLVGTLDPGQQGALPSIEDVRFGTEFGTGNIGVLQLPAEAQVLIGVGYGAYGTEFEGTLTDLPGGGVTPMPPVLVDGRLRSPLIIGDAYQSPTNAFQWQLPAPSGMTAGGATATFSGGMCCEDEQWTTTGTIAESNGVWTLTFELTEAQTAGIEAGDHEWSVQLAEDDVKFTAARGEVEWACR